MTSRQLDSYYRRPGPFCRRQAPRSPRTARNPRQEGLSAAQRDFLDREGYLVIEGVIAPDLLERMRASTAERAAAEGLAAGSVTPTPYQLRSNRRDLPLLERPLAAAYRALFRGVHKTALRWLFRFRPGLELRLRGRSGAPLFGCAGDLDEGQAAGRGLFGRARRELLEMLTAAACTEPGVTRVCDLVNKDSVFDACFGEARVLAAVRHLLGDDLKVSSINYRAARSGAGLQPLHADWESTVEPGEAMACNTLWVLDDFTAENGATRVVPGTHLSRALPEQELDDPRAAHPDERPILAPAGSVIVMNAHTWHGGTCNRTEVERRVIQAYYVRRAFAQQTCQRSLVRPETLERLTEAEQWLLDVAP